MTDNCQTMVPDTTPPPAPDLAAVMAWFESYGAGYNPQYMCEGCIVEGEYSCRHCQFSSIQGKVTNPQSSTSLVPTRASSSST